MSIGNGFLSATVAEGLLLGDGLLEGEGLLLADGLPGEFGLLLGLALEFVSEFVLGSLLSEVTDSDAPGSREVMSEAPASLDDGAMPPDESPAAGPWPQPQASRAMAAVRQANCFTFFNFIVKPPFFH